MSARSVRALRERVADCSDFVLSIDRDALLQTVGEQAQLEEDPDLFVRGMLLHEGLRARARADEREVIELELASGPAMAGAIWATAGAALVAAVGLWAYGLMVGLTGGAVAWAIRRWWRVIARRAPSYLPRGRVLGVVAAAGAILVLSAAVIIPIREIRRSEYLNVVAPAVIR